MSPNGQQSPVSFSLHCVSLVKSHTKEFYRIKLLVDTLYRFCPHYLMNSVLLSIPWRHASIFTLYFESYLATLAISRSGTNQVHSLGCLDWSPGQFIWDDWYHWSIHVILLDLHIRTMVTTYWYSIAVVSQFIEKMCNCHKSPFTLKGKKYWWCTTKPYDYYCVCLGYVHGTATFAVQTTPVSRTATAINYGKYLGRYREYTSAQRIHKFISG